jgi:YD repeat-containing protein
MRNISSRGPGFVALLLFLPALLFVVSLFWHIGQPSAQTATVVYIGPAFSVSYCESIQPPFTAPPCTGGSITASFTFNDLTPGYSGGLSKPDLASWSISGNGVGTLNSGGDFLQPSPSTIFTFTNGVITSGKFSAFHGTGTTDPYIFSNGANEDAAETTDQSTGKINAIGIAQTPPYGIWIGTKGLGKPCNRSTTGGCGTGEPIDLGSGNVFNEATDYETAGQNKLSLIRYYNSFAAPDTYAISMGNNWRTNYDRYLHFVTTSAVEAERPDGQILNFYCDVTNHVCRADPDVDLSLSYSGTTWTLTDQNDTSEIYFTSGSEGVLQSITQRNKYTQALTYSHSQIAFVSDSYARKLTFGYSSGLLSAVSTPEFTSGLTYGYVKYSSSTRLSTVTYATSPATHQTYLYENTSFPLALTGITDENGNRYATWGYDGLGRGILSQLSGAVNYTSVYYNDTTGSRVVKGPLGIVNTYTFTTMQGVPKITKIDRAANSPVVAATSSVRYDSNGYRNSLNDWNGNNTSWTNNTHGLPTAITFASNTTNKQTTNITYDLSWPHLKHTVSANGLNENFAYSSSGNLLTDKLTDTTSTSLPYSTNGQTRTWTYTYNGTGQLLTAQLPRTDVTAKTTYGYTGGTLTSTTDALSHVTTINTATGGGRPLKWTDPNSVHATIAYKTVREWPTSSVIATSAGNLTTSMAYDSAGNLTKTTLPDNSYLSYGYDNAHRVTSITNILGENIGITFNSAGNVTQTLWKNASSVTKRQHTATYDALGERLTDVGGMSQSTAFTYDKNGNVLTITDPLSHVTTQTFDQLNRLSTFKDAETDLSSVKFDSHSRPLTVTDPRGRTTTYVYDGFGDKIQQNSPDSLKTIFYYDADYNLTGRNQSGLNFSSATYDALDRLLTRTYTGDSTLNVSNTYDQAGHGDGIGRLTSLTDQVGSLSRSYDARGNIITDARTITGNLYSNGFSYESAGRLSGVTYASSGWVLAYTRDSAGQITAVTTTQPGHGATNLATSVTHLPFGPLLSLTWGNGVTDARTFDLDYRMTSITDHGTANVQFLSYGYDAGNNATSITDHVTPADNQTFHYDLLSRISFASGPYGSVSSIKFDSNSNRTAYGATAYTIPGLSNRMSKAGASNLTYSSTGNMTGIGSGVLTYNKANQMATAKPATTLNSYFYDAFGQRLKIKTAGTPFRVQIYDLTGKQLTETNSGVETDYAYLDNMPLSAIQSTAATISALHTDNIGTVQRATNAAKTVVWTGNYTPDGAVTPTASITMNLRRLGQYADSTGYNHNNNRDLAPSVFPGYIQSDLVGIAPWLLSPSQGPNTYPFAGGNPITNIDPWGLDATGGLNFGMTINDAIAQNLQHQEERVLPEHTAYGVSAELTLINSLASNPGGAYGYNLEHTPAMGWQLYFFTPSDTGSTTGLNVGAGLQFNVAVGDGEWTGLFNNVESSYLAAQASYFWSPPGTGNWQGNSGGIGVGLPIGLGSTQTNYQYFFPQSQPKTSGSSCTAGR